MNPFLLTKDILPTIFAKTDSAERERLQNGCKQNLKALGKAIAAYRADHDDDMPDWLSDLYPEYLSDPELLLCPADEQRGNPVFKPLTDPKMPCSYLYEFAPVRHSSTIWVFDHHPPEECTYKELKTRQVRYFRESIPVVRCWHHKHRPFDYRSLDLCYGGKIELLFSTWETSLEASQAILTFFRGVIEHDPLSLESEFSLQEIASYFKSCKRMPEFLSLLDGASELPINALRTLVELYEAEREIDSAIESCNRLLHQVPDDVDMRVTLAKLYIAAKNYSAAQAEIDQVLRLEPQSIQAFRLNIELLAIDDAARVQNTLADAPQADDLISLHTRYSVKFQERLLFLEKTLSSTIKEARLALHDSFEDETQVNQLGYLYEAAEKSLSTDAEDWKTYSVSDGLTNDFVFSIAQDRRGVLWIGTGKGVCRYDGMQVRPFVGHQDIDQDTIWSIHIDNEEKLWFATHWHGVFQYDGQDLLNYTISDGLGGNGVKDIYQDKRGDLWFALRGGGISRYDGNNFTTLTTKNGLVGNFVETIDRDSRGNLWVGTWRGVSRFDGKGFTNFTEADGLESDYVNAIVEDHDGYLWLGTSKGVTRSDGEAFTNFVLKNRPIKDGVSDVLVDQEGTLWVASREDGVFRYDRKHFANFTMENGLAGNSVGCAFEDREGNLWFGHGRAEGLSRFNP